MSDLQVHPPRSLWNLPEQHDFSRKQGPIGEVSMPHVQPVFTYPGRRSLVHTPPASPPLLHVLGRTMSLPLSDPNRHPSCWHIVSAQRSLFLYRPNLQNDCQQGTSDFRSLALPGSSVCGGERGNVCSAPQGAAGKTGSSHQLQRTDGSLQRASEVFSHRILG